MIQDQYEGLNYKTRFESAFYKKKKTENGFDKICPFGEMEIWNICETEILP